jgi:hypothetical protein
MADRDGPAAYVNVRLRQDTARELAAAAPSRHVLTTGAQRELLDGLRDALTGTAMPSEDFSFDVLIAEVYLHGPGHAYRWAVRSTCGVVKVWSTRDRCMLAVNPGQARMIGRTFARALEAAADATERASRGEPRVPEARDA